MGKILIANWKMNPTKESEAVKLAKASDAKNVVICPPFPFISAVSKAVKTAAIGAQDVFWEESGAYTGEVSGVELQGLRVSHVIIGHSERRHGLGETDEMVAKKVSAAFTQKITPILCVGETRVERDEQRTKEVIDRQLRSAFSLIPAENGDEKPLVYIAYEPVWAISSNQSGAPTPASPADVVGVIHYMESIVRGIPITPIFIYGGSVNATTLLGFLNYPEIAGALVGAASLQTAEFKKMIKLIS
jgi:triosephosphate isomerase